MKSVLEWKIETILLFVAVFVASLGACAKRLASDEPFSAWKLVADFFLSWLAALMMYCFCKGVDQWVVINEWLIISLVSCACFAGGNAVNFGIWIMKSTAIKFTEKTFGIDLDDSEGMK